MSQYWPWLVAAVVIIVALGAYAGHLLRQLRRQRRALMAAEQAQSAVTTVEPVAADNNDAFRLGAAESIRVLARCYLEGQVGGSEAALRIAVLLDGNSHQSKRERAAPGAARKAPGDYAAFGNRAPRRHGASRTRAIG